MLVTPPAEPKEMEMESLDVDTIGDVAIFILEAPCKDDADTILHHVKQVAAIWEADLDVSFYIFHR